MTADIVGNLIAGGDLDDLLRHADRLCTESDWDGLVELRDRCRQAHERGQQLWPVSNHVEYRLALEAPGRWAAGVLRPGAGRFALGPLSEVAASTHRWDELAPHLPVTPEASFVAHERVVAHFAALAPVVPMKLFTLYETEARAVADLAARREEIEAVLDRVAGCAEWGTRVHFDGSWAVPAERRRSGSETAPPASGRSFLLRKKAEQEDVRNRLRRAGAAVEEAFDELSRQAAASRRREPPALAEPGPRLLLDAAFLVPAAAAEAFENVVQAVAERLAASACRLTLTGPWPPYNFIEEVG